MGSHYPRSERAGDGTIAGLHARIPSGRSDVAGGDLRHHRPIVGRSSMTTEHAIWEVRFRKLLHQSVIPVAVAKEIRIALPAWAASWFLPSAVLMLLAEAPPEASTWVAATLYAVCVAVL